MKKIALLAVPVLAGCLGSAPKPPVTWTIDVESDAKVAFAAVCAPYGGQRFAVLRSDGSIAFDPRNSFAAAPGSSVPSRLLSATVSGRARRLSLRPTGTTLRPSPTRFPRRMRTQLKGSRQGNETL